MNELLGQDCLKKVAWTTVPGTIAGCCESSRRRRATRRAETGAKRKVEAEQAPACEKREQVDCRSGRMLLPVKR